MENTGIWNNSSMRAYLKDLKEILFPDFQEFSDRGEKFEVS